MTGAAAVHGGTAAFSQRRRKRSGKQQQSSRRVLVNAAGAKRYLWTVLAASLMVCLVLCWMVAAYVVLQGNGKDAAKALAPRKEEESVEEDATRRKGAFQVVGKRNVEDDAASRKESGKDDGTEKVDVSKMDSPLLIFTCAREEYLARTLDAVWKYHPLQGHKSSAWSVGAPIVISQDGASATAVTATSKKYQERFRAAGIPYYHMIHYDQMPRPKHMKNNEYAYRALALHYGWALEELFSGRAYQAEEEEEEVGTLPPLPNRVIILEEDIEVAPDFFSFMGAMAPRLDTDETLLAVSAFNDNGRDDLVLDPTRVVRSDFFPGLGWMMTRRLFVEELAPPRWPAGWWDDWIREPPQRRERHILRPEISRSFHFGQKKGASNNVFGKFLDQITLVSHPVDWDAQDLTYLDHDTFRDSYYHNVTTAQPANSVAEALEMVKHGPTRLQYSSMPQFAKIATALQIMKDEKAGVPRTAYRYVVEIRPHKNHMLYISPPVDQLPLLFFPPKQTSLDNA